MSSSASALRRTPDTADQTEPFPYAEAGLPGAASETGNTVDERARARQTEAFEQGRQQALVEMLAAVQNEREHIARALHEFAGEREKYYRRIESEVVQLALAIANKILHREAQLDPHVLAGIVRVTIERMDAGTKVRLHAHPREAAEWRHYFASQMEGELALEVIEDPALAAGECRIETSLGTTEVGFASQLKEIETGLLDLLAERPGSK